MTRVNFRPGVIFESYRNYQKNYWLRKQHSERLCWHLVLPCQRRTNWNRYGHWNIYILRCNINELCSIVILLFSSSVNIFVHVCLSDGLSVSTESFVSSVDKSDRLFELCSYNVRNIWTSYVEYEHSNLFYLTRITVINNKI